MRATEAAKLANVIQHNKYPECLYYKDGDVWCDSDGDTVDLDEMSGCYVPLVPLKTYKIGDEVTFAEALQSGMCFQGNKCKLVYLFRNIPQENRWFSSWSNATMEWIGDASPFNWLTRQNFTIVPDPSIPPKPTIEDLEPWTHFKALINGVEFECVKQPNSYCAHPFWHISGSQWWSNSLDATLTHIKNAAGEWEEV